MSNKGKLLTPADLSRARASARLRRAICAAGLTQQEAGELVGKDGRQVRRWLSGEVPLGALELVAVLEDSPAVRTLPQNSQHAGVVPGSTPGGGSALVAQEDEHRPCKTEDAESGAAQGSTRRAA